ncbi:leucine-rich repeat and calponin homology domain-containing protein isoform X1 [Anopheles moucheti]|uniref:leucine-rich repeat and calponin homology domain-containing protein isoform X1 n=1 Tax=Anopheles moucheti TaxID=186751 RepID=UPI0022F09B1F|nr:leucine-rich repeat and calponin homology domain-containing protein isoform X1 [Anopheles moucheti]XP_052894172.1 leucine-rich repeat and calponin homology domain-containing protein isoform X1 [Anopheles moucheti]
MAVAACLKASQSTVLYSGQAQPLPLVGMNGVGGGTGGHLQSQLTRSLERILEDAHLSGELKLSGRKLKDFPKAAGKYNLSDTVIADLSRNRFCELPEDITCLAFLERLLVYHNTIRSVPETIRGLHSLSYLDLRNNQLSVLPREICALPLQVLLVSNNRLATLPDELGRMEKLTELDAACNQITHLPARMGDLRNMRSLNLRSNQLVYLPRDLTCLQLAFLDISSNKIATLPVELRHMTSLVDLELSNNPLTSPPASLCVRGLVHVFKYLETIASREEKSKTGVDGHATLRRTALSAKNSNSCLLDNQQRNRRAHVDSGYCTSDGGFEGKRWMHDEDSHNSGTASSKWSPTPLHSGFTVMPRNGSNHNTTSNPSSGGPQAALVAHAMHGGSNDSAVENTVGTISGNNEVCWEEEFLKNAAFQDLHPDRKQLSNNNSNDISPEGDITPDGTKTDDKGRTLSNYQTYREYKEALRQQRNLNSVYRSKDHPLTPDSAGSATDSPVSNISPYTKSISSSSVYSSSSQSSPVSPHHTAGLQKMNQMNANPNGIHNTTGTTGGHSSPLLSPNRNGSQSSTMDDSTGGTPNKRPVQKVIPSRNIGSSHHSQSPTHLNGNLHASGTTSTSVANGSHGKIPLANGAGKGSLTSPNGSVSNEYAYVKPNSPCKSMSGALTHNNVPPSSIPKPMAPNGAGGLGSPVLASGSQKPLTATVGYVNNAKPGQKTNKTVSWNRDVPTEKLSFTMRREFDKQKEETELIEQLRQIIETRLKMSLPQDIAPALMDGVVLCHLANLVRPRSVGSIHVPSSAVPKLTMARCRRNVDYFLDACRKIGVDEELICSCQDIVPSTMAEPSLEHSDRKTKDDDGHGSQEASLTPRPPNPLAMYRTIAALLNIPPISNQLVAPPSPSVIGLLRRPRSPPPPPPPSALHSVSVVTAAATNTNSSTDPEKNLDCYPMTSNDLSALGTIESQSLKIVTDLPTTDQIDEYSYYEYNQKRSSEDYRNVPVTLDLPKGNAKSGRKRKFPSSRASRRNHNANDIQSNLNEIIEECEYDSDIGKFRCRTDDSDETRYDLRDYEDSETSLTSCDDDLIGIDQGGDENGDAFTPTNAQPTLCESLVLREISSNDLDTPVMGLKLLKPGTNGSENFNIVQNDVEALHVEEHKVVTKRIEFFENAASTGRKILNFESSNITSAVGVCTTAEKTAVEAQDESGENNSQLCSIVENRRRESDHPMISTILCLGTFLFTVTYLYLYPL